MSDAGADVDDPDAGPGWSVALPLVGAGAAQFFALLLLRNLMEPNNWGLFLAITIVAVVPLGLILWFGFFRTCDPRGWWKIPLVLWPATFLALFTGVAVPGDTSRLQPDDMPIVMPISGYWLAGVRIALPTCIVAQSPEDDDAAYRPVGLANGDMRAINRIASDFGRQMGEDGRAYEAALVEAGYPDLLLARNLRTPADLPAARQRLARVQPLIERFQARYAARIEAVEEQLGRLARESAPGADVMAGFRAAREPTRGRTDQIWRLERDIVQTRRGMLDLLGSTRWHRSGERFVFPAASDQRRFDALEGDVNQARDDQSAWRQEIIQVMGGVSSGSIR